MKMVPVMVPEDKFDEVYQKYGKQRFHKNGTSVHPILGERTQGIEFAMLSTRSMNAHGGASIARMDELMSESGYSDENPSSGPISRLQQVGLIERIGEKLFLPPSDNNNLGMIARQINSRFDFVRKLRSYYLGEEE